MTHLYIGLMSGTSADGIDAALVDFSDDHPQLVGSYYFAYPASLRTDILNLCSPGENEIHRLGLLDRQLGIEFANAVKNLLTETKTSAESICAIGSHGQTIRHYPTENRYSIQIGDPNTISALTGITTIADFRRKDIAFGGQGAPLVPAFHRAIFGKTQTPRVIVNIGGIANITFLEPNNNIILGYDTGPGNVLLDAWIYLDRQLSHDKEGAWAAQGIAHPALLMQCLADPYFQLAPPKSTGREYFNLVWLTQQLNAIGTAMTPVDVQATLVQLTAYSIVNAIRAHVTTAEIIVCGGGAYNTFLMHAMREYAGAHFDIVSSQQYGIAPNWIEAMAFAWLAKQTIEKAPGNLPSATGAMQQAILGGIYFSC